MALETCLPFLPIGNRDTEDEFWNWRPISSSVATWMWPFCSAARSSKFYAACGWEVTPSPTQIGTPNGFDVPLWQQLAKAVPHGVGVQQHRQTRNRPIATNEIFVSLIQHALATPLTIAHAASVPGAALDARPHAGTVPYDALSIPLSSMWACGAVLSRLGDFQVRHTPSSLGIPSLAAIGGQT